MNVFGNYARYYDLLYKDKDYAEEARYVCDLLRRYVPDADSVLEMGCGTGGHAQHLAEAGLNVHGVDLSAQMLEAARARRDSLPAHVAGKLEFSQGDIRNVQTGGTYDGVISLFHVMSYQASNADINAALQTVRLHLKAGGVFIFDCWYGPAVLTDRPAVRVKRLEDDVISVTRIAEPVMLPNENLVDVNYDLFIRDKVSGIVEEVKETHRMRYLFFPEMELLCSQNGLEIIEMREWMSEGEPVFESWNVCFVVRA